MKATIMTTQAIATACHDPHKKPLAVGPRFSVLQYQDSIQITAQ